MRIPGGLSARNNKGIPNNNSNGDHKQINLRSNRLTGLNAHRDRPRQEASRSRAGHLVPHKTGGLKNQEIPTSHRNRMAEVLN